MFRALRTTPTKGSKTVHMGVQMELTFSDEELPSHVDDVQLLNKWDGSLWWSILLTMRTKFGKISKMTLKCSKIAKNPSVVELSFTKMPLSHS